MAMLPIQKTTLNDYANSQPALKPFGALTGKLADDIKLGNLIAGNGLDDSIRNIQFSESVKIAAPAAGIVTETIPMFQAPCNGYLIKAAVYSRVASATWAAGTSTAQSYLFSPVIYYAPTVSAYLLTPVDLLTGMALNTVVELPLGQDVALMTQGSDYAITASGADITIAAVTAFANLPAVGDLIYIRGGATTFVAANLVNVGVYKVTAVTSTSISATKMNKTNPASVTSATAQAADVTWIRTSPQSPGMPMYTGDIVSAAVSIPASGGSPADLSSNYINFSFVFKPSLIV